MANLNHDQSREQILDSTARVIEGKLEGLYRQLYQACTQQMLTPSFFRYKELMRAAELLFMDLDRLITDYQKEVAEDLAADETVN